MSFGNPLARTREGFDDSLMSKSPSRRALIWFRGDLRLDDNPALNFATDIGYEVLPVYVHAPHEEGEWTPGGASRWWLHHSLVSLATSIESSGGQLLLMRSESTLGTLRELIEKHQISAVFWNRRYEMAFRERDEEIKKSLTALGLEVKSFNSQLLWEPWEVSTGESKPYQVFTPFWNKVTSLDAPSLARSPAKKIPWLNPLVPSCDLAEFELLPKLPWAAAFPEHFRPGESGARASLDRFLDGAAPKYRSARDIPAEAGTSRLSPHLHFGEISVRRVWHEVQARLLKTRDSKARESLQTYLKEIAWREFAYHLLFHFPQTSNQPLREAFRSFPWEKSPEQLRAWQEGRTGYPIVDAGLRELWTTGYMHNRVRMIVASFLVKDLRISWLEGAKWFWDTLVDADLASNTLGWQWAGGCGADAAPYFRVFNPTLQGEKFDTEGAYVKRWIPELRNLPAKWIHKPWDAPPLVLSAAGVQLGKNYPRPMVDHKEARDAALVAFSKMKSYTKA
jgi:deoxyribodipyrimidine photo-lyase